jgi:hypothetical protein
MSKSGGVTDGLGERQPGACGAAPPVAAAAAPPPQPAAPEPSVDAEDRNDEEQREVDADAVTKRQRLRVRGDARSCLSDIGQSDRLRYSALKLSGADPARANNHLRSAMSTCGAVSPPSVQYLSKVGGRLSSAGDSDCDYEHRHVAGAMDEVYWNWTSAGQGKGPGTKWSGCICFSATYQAGTSFDPIRRCFDESDISFLEERVECDPVAFAQFKQIACLHRMILKHLAPVMFCDSIICKKACVNRYTKNSRILECNYDHGDGLNKFIIILGIMNLETGEWLNGSSAATSFGVDVYNYTSGSRWDNPTTRPVRYDLQRQGDAMIVRCSRYKSRAFHPPAGFEVWTYVMWFDTEQT